MDTAQELDAIDALMPEQSVKCPYCEDWVAMDGWSMIDAMWLHEYECSGITKAYELAV